MLVIILPCIQADLVSRADVSTWTSGISGSCQQKFKTWKEAYDVYRQSYEKGALKATPLLNGLFDPHCNNENNLIDTLVASILITLDRACTLKAMCIIPHGLTMTIVIIYRAIVIKL